MSDATMTDEEELGGEMTLFEHLAELRKRLIYTIIAMAVGFAISWIFHVEIFLFLVEPLKQAAPTPEMAQLHNKDLTETFIVMLKTSFVSGIFLTIPITLYQIWSFIAPALYEEEKKLTIPFVFMATLFFIGGASFCYFIVMPFGFAFLFEFGAPVANPTIMMSEHYGFTLKLLLAFGAVFELPVLAMFLSAVGLITHQTLINHWRYSVIGAFIFAAILTPPDVGTQLAMAIPLIVLYGFSILVAYFFTKRREKRAAALG